MKNSIGSSVILTVFGESHGEAIGAILDGMAPGIKVDLEFMNECLKKRQPLKDMDTPRKERDNVEIVSGVYNGYTTGSPICVLIRNENKQSADYDKFRGLARPSHVDYSAYLKYHGYEDYRGGGHFSGRITAPIVAAGSICLKALENKGIKIGTHILKIGNVKDANYDNQDLDLLFHKDYPTFNDLEEDIKKEISNAKNNNDSLGGITQTIITGLPGGVGEPMFNSLESELSQALFGIGGIKGIEFGSGFDGVMQPGSKINDQFKLDNGKVVTTTNHSGGINGGISNGMPITFNLAIKPTASILQEQDTINFLTNEEAKLNLSGRHDPSIVRRITVVVNALTAIILCDMLALRFGTDYLK